MALAAPRYVADTTVPYAHVKPDGHGRLAAAVVAAGCRNVRQAPSDLLIVAAAERACLTVLHHDTDRDLIQEAINQPIEWVFRRGSIP